LGLRLPGDLGQDESQRGRPVPRLAHPREEPLGVVTAGAEQQRYKTQGEVCRYVKSVTLIRVVSQTTHRITR